MQFILALACLVAYTVGVSYVEDAFAYLSSPSELDEAADDEARATETEQTEQALFDHNLGKGLLFLGIILAFFAGRYS